MNNLIANKQATMTSTELAELLGYEKSRVNQRIKEMFQSEIDDTAIASSIDSRGYVTDYYLPEVESNMFVARWDYTHMRKLVTFWVNRKEPAQPLWLLSLSPEAQVAISDLSKQRDEAVKTKAQINDKRTATLMNKASQDSKKIKKLESQLQNVGDYISLMAAELPQRIDTEFKANVQTWRVLKAISKQMHHEIIKAKDERYGEVNTYHMDVIEQFKEDYL